MMKYLFVVLLSLSALMRASSPELFYDAGIVLGHQEKIVDWQSFKNGAVAIYDEVQDVQDLVSLFVMMDENFGENDVVPFDQLIDAFDKKMSENDQYENFKTDLIIFFEAYQRIFFAFTKICPIEPSFEIFSNCLDDYLESSDPLYDEIKDAMNDYAVAFNILEDKMDELF